MTADPNLFPHYEVDNGVVVKYYFFGGQRVAMRRGSTLTYLHGDHLSSTVLETNVSGAIATDQKYFAYGKQRDTGTVTTDHRFTGQKQDASGLQYFNARFYDPAIGMFVSPDTITPDPGNVLDYNKYMFVRGNPLKFNDPTGHQANCAMDQNLNLTCTDNAVTGGKTLVSNVSLLTPPCLSNCPKSVTEIVADTLTKLKDVDIPVTVTFEKGAPVFNIDQSKLSEALLSPLQACASAVGGACGFSFEISTNGAGAGARGGVSIYVDPKGNAGIFGQIGGGAYSPWPAPVAKYSVTGIPDAMIQDIDGMSAQVGGSGAFGPAGFAAEGVLMRADGGKFLKGQSLGYAHSVSVQAEGHFTFEYARPIVYINSVNK